MDTGVVLARDTLRTLFAHGIQRPDTAFVTGSSGFDPFSNPGFLLCEFTIKFVVRTILSCYNLVLSLYKTPVVTGIADQLSPVYFDNPAGEFLKQRPVVCNEQYRPRK